MNYVFKINISDDNRQHIRNLIGVPMDGNISASANENKRFNFLNPIKNKFYYLPSKTEQFTRPHGDLEDVYIKDKNGYKLHAWYFNPLKPATSKLILFSHGNYGNLTFHSRLAAEMMNLNIPFLMYDYKGFGRSEGKTHMESTYDDALEWYNYLLNEKGIKKNNIASMGNSIGSYPATKLATIKRLHKLIILSGFNSISEVVRDIYAPPLNYVFVYATSGDLNVDQWISQYDYDPLILHSKGDMTISFRNAELNASYGGNLVEIIGDHNNYEMNWQVVLDYLNN